MRTANTQSLNSTNSNVVEFSDFSADLNRVYEALKETPLTMKEVDIRTGVMRESVCRHISTLLKAGLIVKRKVRRCTVTGYPYVNEYTGDSRLFPKKNQLSLF